MADITVLDAEAITDRSTIKKPCIHPTGIAHVLVNGKFAIKNSERMEYNSGRVLRYFFLLTDKKNL